MMKRLARYGLVIYVVQALAGTAIFLYLGVFNPEVVEKVVSCVTS